MTIQNRMPQAKKNQVMWKIPSCAPPRATRRSPAEQYWCCEETNMLTNWDKDGGVTLVSFLFLIEPLSKNVNGQYTLAERGNGLILSEKMPT